MKENMSISYAIWLGNNCSTSIYGCFTLINRSGNSKDLFYLDSGTDMEELYELFLKEEKE